MVHMPQKAVTIVGVDLLRFFSALLVMGFHLTFWGWWSPGSPTGMALKGAASFPTLGEYFKGGWIGVPIFFVISGFVISLTAENRSGRKFFIARASRILPAIWVCATITLIVQIFNHSHSYLYLLLYYSKSLILFPSGPWIDVVYWTLPVEVLFYSLIFALLYFHGLQYIRGLAVTIALVSTLGTFIQTEIFFLSYGCCFSLGIAFWLLTKRLTLTNIFWALSFFAGALFEITRLDIYAVIDSRIPLITFSAAMIALVFSLLMQQWIIRILPKYILSMIRQVGLATYPLYLIHNVIGATLIRWIIFIGATETVSLWMSATICVLLSFAISSLVEPSIRQVVFQSFHIGAVANETFQSDAKSRERQLNA
jgi:peptidoglycan/LPS O-acetylase OafA/YrhL